MVELEVGEVVIDVTEEGAIGLDNGSGQEHEAIDGRECAWLGMSRGKLWRTVCGWRSRRERKKTRCFYGAIRVTTVAIWSATSDWGMAPRITLLLEEETFADSDAADWDHKASDGMSPTCCRTHLALDP